MDYLPQITQVVDGFYPFLLTLNLVGKNDLNVLCARNSGSCC